MEGLDSAIIKTWGAWGAVLIAVAFFIWKWVLPRVDRWLDDRREQKRLEREAALEQRRLEREAAHKRDQQFIELIKENLDDEQESRATERDKFLSVVDGSLKQQTEVLQSLTESVNEALKKRSTRQ